MIAAGEMASRAQMVTRLIEMADILSDKQGNLVSFMAIIDGLALPQVRANFLCCHGNTKKLGFE